jgi:hypothetical protein
MTAMEIFKNGKSIQGDETVVEETRREQFHNTTSRETVANQDYI